MDISLILTVIGIILTIVFAYETPRNWFLRLFGFIKPVSNSNETIQDETKLLDVTEDGVLTFFSTKGNQELHELYFKDKRLIKIDYQNPEFNYKNKQIIVNGGNPNNPIWGEYIDSFPKTIQPYLIEIRKVIEKNHWENKTGEEMNKTLFEFIDGVTFGFTWRAWGDFTQSINYQRDGYLKHYM
jgi:hypothetical protein